MESDQNKQTGGQSASDSHARHESVFIWTIGALLVVVLALGGYIAYSAGKNAGNKTVATATPVALKTATPVQAPDGVTWIVPEKLGDLSLFTKNNSNDEPGGVDTISYYRVGRMADKSDVIDAVITFSPSGYDVYRIIKKADLYYIVDQNSSELRGNSYAISSSVSHDKTTIFRALSYDKKITQGQTVLTYAFNGGIEKAKGYGEATKVSDTRLGTLYKESSGAIGESGDTVDVDRYFVKLADSSRAYYEVKPSFLRDDGTLNISWSDPNKSALTYQMVKTSGCGNNGSASFPAVANAGVLDGKEQVASNAKVYFISDKNNPLDAYIYKIYKESTSDAKSIDDFINNVGMLVWYDDYGSPIVFSNKAYSFEGECGKPVVYLYPQETMPVSVKVAAAITKSDPTYQKGWQVVANPSGQIEVAGQTYPYLFWEGTGLGSYPAIEQGTIVESAKALETIKQQLSFIGLNQKEIADFVDFWGGKLPKTKYTRLTWLQNSELDELAPLKVTPTPQSVIRVFLDFAGLDQQVSLAPQKLTQYKREGFTVVEWGGLLGAP